MRKKLNFRRAGSVFINIKTNTAMLFAVVLAASSLLPAAEVFAGPPVPCEGPIIAFGRQDMCGYFDNQGYDPAPEYEVVRPGGVPAGVDTAQEFIDMITNDLSSGDPQTVTGAQFLVLTMIGAPAGSARTVTPAQLTEWEARVMSYADITDVPGNSTGTNGSIEWSASRSLDCGEINTYYQEDANDVGAFVMTPTTAPFCDMTGPEPNIAFIDNDSNDVYVIRRDCMNPVGVALTALPAPNLVDPPSFEKTYTVDGPVIQWKLVWINQTSISNMHAQAEDDIPTGTTYIADSLTCEARGTSTTDICAYDSAANKVTWSGLVGADEGNTDEASAQNEIVMTFDTSLLPGTTDVSNQAACSYDENGDGFIEPSEEGNCASNQVLASGLYIGPDGSLADTGSPTLPLIAIGIILILGSLFVLIKRPWALRA